VSDLFKIADLKSGRLLRNREEEDKKARERPRNDLRGKRTIRKKDPANNLPMSIPANMKSLTAKGQPLRRKNILAQCLAKSYYLGNICAWFSNLKGWCPNHERREDAANKAGMRGGSRELVSRGFHQTVLGNLLRKECYLGKKDLS